MLETNFHDTLRALDRKTKEMTRSFVFFHGFVLLFGYAAMADDQPFQTVDDVARSFRIATYEEFRTDRANYDKRIKPARKLMEEWRAAEMPATHEQAVRDWFAAAKNGELNPLPELPEPTQVAVDENPFEIQVSDAPDDPESESPKKSGSVFSSMKRALFGGSNDDSALLP